MSADDTAHMAHALALGRRGLGNCWPNPAVGCVIVKDGRIVGRGWTQPGGRPHAEVVALTQAGTTARGATAYVTLEPCAHHGKTPPCADALVTAGVARVVAALEDSDPRVSGQGFARLRSAGIAVTTDVLADQALRDQEGFFRKVEQGRPMVTLKLACSFDGRIATATGESQWITGPEARRRVHAMRLSHDAVMVGAGTVRADDPTLNVRGMGTVRQPLRVVVSRHLDLPIDSALAQTARDIPVWICHGPSATGPRRTAWADTGAHLIEARVTGGQMDMGDVLRLLGTNGLTRVFCEGGGALAASLLQAGLVDRLAVFTAGMALGAEGRPALGALGIDTLAEAPRFALDSVEICGADVLQLWRRA
ncbi:bifunctional diaminohydroxyphosphoribosylaminopyrimidine deaminase/5-amino-6-(5-phosphoribosylamino)uracil reductase RibD [Mesobacterium sp. TK19101]|uniref:Riboflavin biosynthesis protein RibD n=1 Tax=Mesobacterium hydrothermale TaxID=3111907 RepID=A0ABU6HBX6_9RHOB|nr:bifunctional diaminohydroxyphosphoribosylaminopyrimidine deaminase/5-amino-6-(5-phosphoribosylamino)uracil reductase RibD [Mesobacterium sp. TK19101]MEC3859972.1 bifunctional diaminohydroxyphosphoribosylaminopyrimidine deaminase/5-amino-6-(5-phosphoribosylamino)uracil reductase RibD [Mesobacterium sp. TK19101]